jgi:hypothetical protein
MKRTFVASAILTGCLALLGCDDSQMDAPEVVPGQFDSDALDDDNTDMTAPPVVDVDPANSALEGELNGPDPVIVPPTSETPSDPSPTESNGFKLPPVDQVEGDTPAPAVEPSAGDGDGATADGEPADPGAETVKEVPPSDAGDQ